MMQVGLDLLYAKGDPVAATAQFRKVLEPNPTHYGATFQLAMALDRAGNPGEGRPLWEKVLKMAEENNDGEAAATARGRGWRGSPDVAGHDQAREQVGIRSGIRRAVATRDRRVIPIEGRVAWRRPPVSAVVVICWSDLRM